eukprot:5910716-Prorocentrum_lima.AAC.1
MCGRPVARFWEAGLIEDTDPQGWEERVTLLHEEFSTLVNRQSSSFFHHQDLLQPNPLEQDL